MSSLTTSIVVFVASIVAALLGYALQRPLRLAAPGDEMRSAARASASCLSPP